MPAKKTKKAAKKAVKKPKKAPDLKLKPGIELEEEGPPDLLTLELPSGQKKPTLMELVEIYKISRATLYRYQQDGVDIWDPKDLKHHIDRQVVKPPSYRMEGGIKTFEQARLRKTLLEAELKMRQIDREDEAVIPRELQREDGMSAGAQLQAGILALESELPPILVGLTEPQMQKRLRPILRKLLSDFVNPESDLYLAKNL